MKPISRIVPVSGGLPSPPTPSRSGWAARLWGDTRGAYQAEYTVLLLLVTLIAGLAIAGLGLPLLAYHRSVQLFSLLPFP